METIQLILNEIIDIGGNNGIIIAGSSRKRKNCDNF